MAARRLRRIPAQLSAGVCAVVFGFVLIENAPAQQIVPQVPPPPPPVVNPSPPNTTVPQPSYKPVSPATPGATTPSAVPGPEVTSPVNEPAPRTAPRESETTSVENPRSVRHHRARSIPVTYRCGTYGWGYYGCWRTYPWAFPCQYYSTYCYSNGYYRPDGWSFYFRTYGEYRD